jgi:hypothetical protein
MMSLLQFYYKKNCKTVEVFSSEKFSFVAEKWNHRSFWTVKHAGTHCKE